MLLLMLVPLKRDTRAAGCRRLVMHSDRMSCRYEIEDLEVLLYNVNLIRDTAVNQSRMPDNPCWQPFSALIRNRPLLSTK